jgi:tetratricopeptide (TPR) repeat protein
MLAKCMRLAIGVAALAVSVATASAQTPKHLETYRAAIETYVATGDAVVAVKPLIGWSRDELEAAVKNTADAADNKRIEAAAMLHLEFGAAVVGLSTPSAEAYFELATDLLAGLTPPPGAPRPVPARREEVARIRSTWLRVAGSALLSVGDVTRGRQFLSQSLRLLRSAETLTLRGIADEMDGVVYNPDDWDLTTQKTRAARERTRLLIAAETFYREALRENPDYALAHIRLGRVMFLTGKTKEARAYLERGLAAATKASDRYFGAMFMGALQQSARDYANARQSFELAVTIAPGSQSAIAALAYVELLGGRPDRAQQLARTYITSVDPNESWWSFKNPTFDTAGMAWLKKRVVP